MLLQFTRPKSITLPIQGSENSFPVNHIYCVGRNYAAHAREMGVDVKDTPIFFSKPNWALVTPGTNIDYPTDTDNLNHEVELVIAIGENMSIFGFGVGVDLTKRDIQTKAKKDGKPWFRSKCFAGSAPVSKIIPAGDRTDFSDFNLALAVNGKVKQMGSCSDMIWNPGEIMCELAREVPLQAGDLIFTGTPEGVGKLKKGDDVVISIPELVELSFKIF